MLAAITMLLSYVLLRHLGASVEEAKTLETIIFCVIGWRVIAAIERPLRGWRAYMVVGLVLLLVIPFVVPWGREFFALHLPGLVPSLATAGICVFAWFFVGLGWRIGRRLPFWKEAAQREAVEREAAEREAAERAAAAQSTEAD